MKSTCLPALLCAMVLPLISACGAGGASGGHSMDQITATIEKQGFTCTAQERLPKSVYQVAQCRSKQDKYLILTISQWRDTKERDHMYEVKVPATCKKAGLKSDIHWSTAGNWALVAGGGRDRDVKALQAASSELGFEPHSATCQ